MALSINTDDGADHPAGFKSRGVVEDNERHIARDEDAFNLARRRIKLPKSARVEPTMVAIVTKRLCKHTGLIRSPAVGLLCCI